VFELVILRGVLRLLWERIPVTLRPRERVLLAALVTAPGFTLPASELTHRLSLVEPSIAARDTTRSHAAHIRDAAQALAGPRGRGILVTERVRRGGSYRLGIGPEHVDSFRFEQLADSGHRKLRAGLPQLAAAVFEEALALWGGDPLADTREFGFADREIARLTGIYRNCVVALAEIQSSQRRYRDVTGRLEELAGQLAVDLAVWELLAVSYYRDGRDGEAILTCKRAIEKFLDRGLATRRLDAILQAMLKGDFPRQEPQHLLVP
jgi:DNA-binding SARP family transcriptional activator